MVAYVVDACSVHVKCSRTEKQTMPQQDVFVRAPKKLSSFLFYPYMYLRRRPRQPLPFVPIVKDPPVLACDHPEGVVDGYDRPLHLFDEVLNSSVLHKCASDFVAQILGSSHRYCFRRGCSVRCMKMRYEIYSTTIPQEGSRGDSEMSDIPHRCFWLLFASVACAVCDTLCTKQDCVWLTAQELPNRHRLTAEQFLLDCDAVRD